MISLGEELGSGKLGDHRSEDLVAEGRENFTLITLPQIVVNGTESVNFRMEQDSDGESNHLHVSVRGFSFYLILSSLDIVDDGIFDEGELEIEALPVSLGGESEKLVEFDGIVSDIN